MVVSSTVLVVYSLYCAVMLWLVESWDSYMSKPAVCFGVGVATKDAIVARAWQGTT